MKAIYKYELQECLVYTDKNKEKNIHEVTDLAKQQPCLLLLQDHSCPLDRLCTGLVPQIGTSLHLQRFLKMVEMFNQIVLSHTLSWSFHIFPLIMYLEAHP